MVQLDMKIKKYDSRTRTNKKKEQQQHHRHFPRSLKKKFKSLAFNRVKEARDKEEESARTHNLRMTKMGI
jgi:hypothetical protein